MTGAGRYAPSPSGDLHLGNLRTALLAWTWARRSGRRFVLRIEDLDAARSRDDAAARQLEDLASLGLHWDDSPLKQSGRDAAYAEAVARLRADGLVYECFCSRREILDAPRAPHAPPGAYPGTCRTLDPAGRDARRATLGPGRSPALRLRAGVTSTTVHDEIHGEFTGDVDDMVLRRGDGVWAYNLAVVVDDAFQGIDQVVRGDDLLASAPRQAYLAGLLRLPIPAYVHVPLVLNARGQRLAKRDGAVTLRELVDDRVARGIRREAALGDVLETLAASLGVPDCRSAADFLRRFDPASLGHEPWTWTPDGGSTGPAAAAPISGPAHRTPTGPSQEADE